MEKKKGLVEKLGIIIMILCFLVIVESFWVVGRLSKRIEVIPSPVPQERSVDSVRKVKLYFSGPSSWRKGEEREVRVMMVPLNSLSLRGVDLVFGYKPKFWKMTEVVNGEIFEEMGRVLDEPEKKRIVISLSTLDPEGKKVVAGEELVLATVRIMPLADDLSFDWELIEGTKIVPLEGKVVYQGQEYQPSE